MSVLIKICGLSDAASVAAAVDAGADAIGFVFAASPRRVNPQKANAVSQNVPAHIRRVAVMRHPSNDEWRAVLDAFAPDVLQTDIEDFAELDVPPEVLSWPVIREGSAAAKGELPDVFVYEGAGSGVGQKVNWSHAAALADQGRMILAGGLAADNVAAALEAVRPWGVDVSSGVESQRGKKDVRLIQQFIGAVRAAENNG
jgi:phosphoribosylanthranilate isomerase